MRTSLPCRTPILVALSAAAALLAFSGVAAAQGKAAPAKKAPKVTTFTGEIAKTVGKKGKITAAQLKAADGKVLHLVLDKQGLKLAKEFGGKQAEASGVTFDKGKGKAKKTFLRVKTFKAAPEPAPATDDDADEGGGDDEDEAGDETE